MEWTRTKALWEQTIPTVWLKLQLFKPPEKIALNLSKAKVKEIALQQLNGGIDDLG